MAKRPWQLRNLERITIGGSASVTGEFYSAPEVDAILTRPPEKYEVVLGAVKPGGRIELVNPKMGNEGEWLVIEPESPGSGRSRCARVSDGRVRVFADVRKVRKIYQGGGDR